MVDTSRSLAALQTLLADNTSGAISPQDVRDMLVSVYPGWRPSTEGFYDDYFDEDGSADWTAVAPDSGSVTWAYNHEARLGWSRGLAVRSSLVAANDVGAYLKPIPGVATSDYIQTQLSVGAQGFAAGYLFGLVFTDGSTSAANVAGACWSTDSNASMKINSLRGTLTSIGNGLNFTDFVMQGSASIPTHLRIVFVSTTSFTVWLSLDGTNFVQVGANTGISFTPTHAGFVLGQGFSNPQFGLAHYFHSNVTP